MKKTYQAPDTLIIAVKMQPILQTSAGLTSTPATVNSDDDYETLSRGMTLWYDE